MFPPGFDEEANYNAPGARVIQITNWSRFPGNP